MATFETLLEEKKANQNLVGKRFIMDNMEGIKTIAALVVKPQKEAFTYGDLEDEFDPEVNNYVYITFAQGSGIFKIRLEDFHEPRYQLLD